MPRFSLTTTNRLLWTAQVLLAALFTFAGVSKYPARVKCALLSWMAWKDATAKALSEEAKTA